MDGHGKAVAAVNIGAQASRASAKQMEQQFLPHLQAAARELGMLLACKRMNSRTQRHGKRSNRHFQQRVAQ